MRLIAFTAALITLAAFTTHAQVHVNGYTRRDGTYVAPHYRSSPDSSRLNNWSTQGNVNPYTGQEGTRNPYSNTYSRGYSVTPQQNNGNSHDQSFGQEEE